MSDLLANVIEAHGGLPRWRGFSEVRATIVTWGALWGIKGLVQDPNPREMTVRLHEEWASVLPYGKPNQKTVFTPDPIAIMTTAVGSSQSARILANHSMAMGRLLRGIRSTGPISTAMRCGPT